MLLSCMGQCCAQCSLDLCVVLYTVLPVFMCGAVPSTHQAHVWCGAQCSQDPVWCCAQCFQGPLWCCTQYSPGSWDPGMMLCIYLQPAHMHGDPYLSLTHLPF